MLHPIKLPDSHIALTRSIEFQVRLIDWLSANTTTSEEVTIERACQREPAIAEWLTWFMSKKGILEAMQHLAALTDAEKARIRAHNSAVLAFHEHFDPANHAPTPWPPQYSGSDDAKVCLKILLEGLYTEAFSSSHGLPYDAASNPVGRGLNRRDYVDDFRTINFGRVCPGCDGDLNAGQEFDHWIGKARYPNLSISPLNLVLFCHKCNSSECKGQKPTYSVGGKPFDEWFHPWLRQAFGKFHIEVNDDRVALMLRDIGDLHRVAHLNKLLSLIDRWNDEAESQIKECLATLEVLLEENAGAARADALARLQQDRAVASNRVGKRPHAMVAKAVLESALANPTTVDAWLDEVRMRIP